MRCRQPIGKCWLSTRLPLPGMRVIFWPMPSSCSQVADGRAYSLAVLASEEWAKAYSVLTLSLMPPAARAQVPVREFLEGHRLKNASALLLRLVDGAQPGVASRVAAMTDLAGALRAAEAQAGNANAGKQRGLYADLMADGALSLPSGIRQAEAAAAVTQAREVGASAALLHDPDALAALADPPPEALTLAEAAFGFLSSMQGINDPETAADALRDMAGWLKRHTDRRLDYKEQQAQQPRRTPGRDHDSYAALQLGRRGRKAAHFTKSDD